MGNKWTIDTLKLMSPSGKRDTECLGVKEGPYLNFVEVDKKQRKIFKVYCKSLLLRY